MQNFLIKASGLTKTGLVLRQVPPFQQMFSSGVHDTYNDWLLFLNTSISSVGAAAAAAAAAARAGTEAG